MRNPAIHRRIGLLSLTLCFSVAIASSSAASSDANQAPKPYTVTLPKSVVKVNMVPIPGGTIKIGNQTVNVKPIFMSTTEVPWEAFDLFLQSGEPTVPYDQKEYGPDAIARPSKSYILPDLGWGHRGWPVINVHYETVVMFCRWLSKETGKNFRLPTEAEWEFAARGGDMGEWKLDKDSALKVAWFKENSENATHQIGTKAANTFGLFDMLGNAGEWATDLKGEPVLCGPTWQDPLSELKPTVRRYWEPAWQESDPQIPKSRWWLSNGSFVGFRVVCEN
jgi:formylglycine-generating enzyme required for sulfatase activity